MAARSRDRLPLLATRRYIQWQSHFLRYIDTRPNGDALRKYILKEKEAIHLLLTGIGEEIYSTVDACKTTHDMWIAIEQLQHGDIFKSVSTAVHFRTSGESFVAGTTRIMTVEVVLESSSSSVQGFFVCLKTCGRSESGYTWFRVRIKLCYSMSGVRNRFSFNADQTSATLPTDSL
nr:hypothetical protein [Tanacetum cinerariifolium]